MKSKRTMAIVSVCMALFIGGCAASRGGQGNPPVTYLQVEDEAKPLSHKIALALVQRPSSRFGSQLADMYISALVDTIRDGGPQVALAAPRDPDYPEFMQSDALAKDAAPDVFDLAEEAREQGYQGFVTASVSGLQTSVERWGFLWFHKTNYYISYSAEVSLYDAFTAAKIVDIVREKKLSIDMADYEGFRDQSQPAIGSLDESVAKVARGFGKKIVDALEDQPWKATVAAVQDNRLFFETGNTSGLEINDELVVFARRQIIRGKDGARFILTGPEIGKARITAIKGGLAEAVVEDGSGIQAGDLLVAVK